jgi:hypothetical protein
MDIRTPLPTNYGDWMTKFGETWKSQISQLQQAFGNRIQEVRMPSDYPTDVPIIYVEKQAIVDVLKFLKTETGFEYNFLSDLTATDESEEGKDYRFEVIYNLYSVHRHWRIRVKTRVREGEEVHRTSRLEKNFDGSSLGRSSASKRLSNPWISDFSDSRTD